MTITQQKNLALRLLEWHGGQDTGLYAVGSCMLADAERGKLYRPENWHGHADGVRAYALAVWELRRLRQDAKYPDAVTDRGERDANGDLPAFPVIPSDLRDSAWYASAGLCGLTKREEFAKAAMQGLLSSAIRSDTFENYAKCAVHHADALLAALEAKP